MFRALIVFYLAILVNAGCASPIQSDPVSASGDTGNGSLVASSEPESAAPEPSATAPEEPEAAVPTDEEVMYRVFSAELLGNKGDLEGAVSEYLEAALESNDPDIARRATRVAFAAQTWMQAAMAADRWALLAPDNADAHESSAVAKLITGDYVGAEVHIERLLDLATDRTEIWAKITTMLGRSPNPEKAAATLDRVMAGRGEVDDADALYARSQLAVRSGDFKKAFALAEQAAEADSQRVDILTWAGRLALNLNESKLGMNYIRRAWELEPKDHDLALAYADLLSRNGDKQRSREIVRGLEQTPDIMLTRILYEINDDNTAEAQALYDELDTTDFEDHNEKAFFQAQAAEALSKRSEAIKFYGRVKGGENLLPAAIRRAELLAMNGELATARAELEVLREHDNETFVEESWMAEARVLRQAGDLGAAMQTLGMALEQLAFSISIRYAHALLAAELGEVAVAEKDLRIILAEQPDNAAALNALGYTLADQTDRFEEAEELIRAAYTLSPDEASIVDSMGWISFKLGRLAESEEFLRRAWELDGNPEIAAHLGEVLWLRGKTDEAKEVWRAGMEVDDQNKPLIETVKRLEIELDP
jgi:tetratricopeptide (TPR) repeat protein